MMSPTARNGNWRAIAVLLFLGNACSADKVEIGVNLEIPPSIHFDSLRLLRIIDSREPTFVRAWQGPLDAGEHSAGFKLPRGTTAKLRMDAILMSNVVGQVSFTISDGVAELQVEIGPCKPFPATELQGICEMPNSDTGNGGNGLIADAGADADSGTDADAGVALADANGAEASSSPWIAPACLPTDLDAGTPPLPPPLPSTPACDLYCAAMAKSCSFVYGSDEMCHLACARIDWPDQDPSRDTVTCRTDWAVQAAPGPSQTITCEKAGLVSRNNCGSNCENYCRAGIQLCPAEFPSGLAFCTALCLEAQAKYTIDFPGRSFLAELLICRVSYLEMAVANPALCQLAGPNDCGTACEPVLFPPL